MAKKKPSDSFHFLQELSEKTSKIIFAYQVNSNQLSYLNPAFEKIWNMPVDRVKANPASLLNAVHPDDRDYLINSFKEFLKGNN